MERVLLKVHHVEIRLKEDVDIQIVIKKGTESFAVPRKAKLSKGKCLLGAHAEFFVSSKDPSFDINVNIIHGSAKRFAGMCQVDLKDWEENSNNSTTSLLEKSPDNKARIMFDFIFMSSDLIKPTRGLISQGQLQTEKRGELIKDAEEKNIMLTNENKRLTEEVAMMKKKNKDLAEMTEYVKKEVHYKEITEKICNEVKVSQNSLRLMTEKMIKLEAIINNCGDPEMKEKMVALQSEFTKVI